MLSSYLRLAVIAGTVLLVGTTPTSADGITHIEELCRSSEWLPADRERSPLVAAYCQITEDPDPIYLRPAPPQPVRATEGPASHDSALAVDSEIDNALQLPVGLRWSLWLIAIVR